MVPPLGPPCYWGRRSSGQTGEVEEIQTHASDISTDPANRAAGQRHYHLQHTYSQVWGAHNQTGSKVKVGSAKLLGLSLTSGHHSIRAAG